ncbi:Prefoldin subunit-domain-containing protein [Annulohypoxylon maeteangense]|uniref:Prefoldin subunit-domain-containing protein n=1 Tax=Annulohypoxylon maeteangense TaxID=1927788 RepID=UPI002007E666|nr:Prefoldin subunit-domain-containing protein [Annulohypoxylon maeteangense]KAI0881583.1 Prefoldin subunit-domain-containing protein [Annulohypoxylon maeteangense]
MAPTKDSFFDLERQRRKLEENVEKLSKALEYWKQSQEEYETLRKAVQSSASREELRNTRDQFEGKILDKKELDVIFGPNVAKTAEQIGSVLTNRVDYVAKNVGTLNKQLEDVQNKLAAVTVVTNPDATDEEGLPITEIMEELDDDDNVVSYTLRTPGDNRPQILETLRKAGITDFESPTNSNTLHDTSSHEVKKDEPQNPTDDESPSTHQSKQSQPTQQPKETSVEEQVKPKPAPKKKSVAFTEDTKPGEEKEQSDTAKRLEEILQRARDQQSIISNPVFPADEAPEDAALREDMIRYNKQTMEYEMAPIVAELQLEEGSSADDTDDYSDYDDDGYDEDELGRTKVHVDDDWKRYMLELKEKLTGYEFKKDTAADEENDMVEGVGRITIRHEGQDVPNSGSEPAAHPNTEASAPTKEIKKSVKFAASLDIADTSVPVPAPAPAPQQSHPEINPISEVVMERNGGTHQPRVTSSKKASRFRKARGTDPSIMRAPVALDGTPIAPDRPDINIKPIPSGPNGQTIAKSVFEHEPSSQAKEPDEFDANLLHNQATEEYYKMRNRLVHRNGGFMKEDENPIQPLDEEDGGPKRMSRFKAARLAKS